MANADLQLLTENEVADLTRTSPRTLQKYRATGDGPPFLKLGKCIRYRQKDVLDWFDRQTRRSTAEADA